METSDVVLVVLIPLAVNLLAALAWKFLEPKVADERGELLGFLFLVGVYVASLWFIGRTDSASWWQRILVAVTCLVVLGAMVVRGLSGLQKKLRAEESSARLGAIHHVVVVLLLLALALPGLRILVEPVASTSRFPLWATSSAPMIALVLGGVLFHRLSTSASLQTPGVLDGLLMAGEKAFVEAGLHHVKNRMHGVRAFQGGDAVVKDKRMLLGALYHVMLAMKEIENLFSASYDRGLHRDHEAVSEHVVPGRQWSIQLAEKAKNILLRHLEQMEFPRLSESSIVTDETGTVRREGEFTWVLDPLDGSRHFRRQLPLFTTAVALLRGDEPELAVIYAPVTRELFFAVRDCGSYLNSWDLPLQVSSVPLEDAVVHVEFPNVDLREKNAEAFDLRMQGLARLMGTAKRTRGLGLGTLGLAYLAKGAFDAYVTLPGTTLRTDVTAGVLLVREAGGHVDLRDTKDVMRDGVLVLASNPETFQQLERIVEL